MTGSPYQLQVRLLVTLTLGLAALTALSPTPCTLHLRRLPRPLPPPSPHPFPSPQPTVSQFPTLWASSRFSQLSCIDRKLFILPALRVFITILIYFPDPKTAEIFGSPLSS